MSGKTLGIVLVLILLLLTAYLTYNLYINLYSQPKSFTVTYPKFETSMISDNLQFYQNMRFSHNDISYRLGEECDEQKRKDMNWAFNSLENRTSLLRFYEITEGEDIIIRCGEEYKKGNLFVLGEGGPEFITNTSIFSVIVRGNIIFLSSHECSNNVALHELLHVFGFQHSNDKRSIMYNLTSCDQVLSDMIVDELKRLYSIRALPDLYFESANGTKRGSYINLNFVVMNQGLQNVENATVALFGNEKKLEEFSLENINVGAGKIFFVENLRVPASIANFKLKIMAEDELNRDNNEITLSLESA